MMMLTLIMAVLNFLILIVYIIIACYTRRQAKVLEKNMEEQYRPILVPINMPGKIHVYPCMRVIMMI